jgi:sugar O-acyltransferase (sialic acid O-acetyltransferase NeuD family)
VKGIDMVEKKTPVVILGAGGFASVVTEILSQSEDMLVIGCTDKALGLSERSADDQPSLRILGDDDVLPQLAEEYEGLNAILGLGPELMDVRARLIRVLDLVVIPPASAIHPSAVVSRLASWEAGTVIGAGAVVGVNVKIGRHCVLNLGASIAHDARLGANVWVGQGARIASYTHLANDVVIEMGASINSRVTVGRGARITGGAFVNTDVPDHAVVVGVPGRIVRYLAE